VTETNCWPEFHALADDPEDVFAALQTHLGRPQLKSRGRLYDLGDPPRYRIGWSRDHTPRILALGSMTAAEIHRDVELCAALLTPAVSRWFTFPMVGHFRTSGALAGARLQVRSIDDLNEINLPSPYRTPEAASPLLLSALLVDVQYEPVEEPFVTARRLQAAVHRAANIVTLCSFQRLATGGGNEAWTQIWDPATSTYRNARTNTD